MPTVVGAMISLRSGCLSTSAERLVVRLLRLVVAVDGVDELEVGVLRIVEDLVERRDPGVLVGRVRRRRQDGELAAVVAEDVDGPCRP